MSQQKNLTRTQYRISLLHSFETAQNDYQETRRKEGKEELPRLEQMYNSASPLDKIKTCFPVPDYPPMQPYLKKCKVRSWKVVLRFFTVEDNQFLSYKSAEQKKPSKSYEISGVSVQIDSDSKAYIDSKDHCWDVPTCKNRMRLEFKARRGKTIYIYANNLHYLKGLKVQLKLKASSQFADSVKIKMGRACTAMTLNQESTFWAFCLRNMRPMRCDSPKIHEEQPQKPVNFDLKHPSTQNTTVAKQKSTDEGPVWQRQSEKSIKKQVFPTYRIGRKSNFASTLPSAVLSKRLQQLAHLVKTRRESRPEALQSQLDEYLNSEARGFHCDFVQESSGYQADTCHVLFDGDSLIIQNLSSQRGSDPSTFFETKMVTTFNLGEVSMIATNKGVNKIQLYGPVQEDFYKGYLEGRLRHAENEASVVSELEAYAPLRRHASVVHTIEVLSVLMSVPLYKVWRHKTFFRLKLTQFRGKEPSSDSFCVFSPPKQVDFVKSTKEGCLVDLDYKFKVDSFGEGDFFQLSVMVYPCLNPVAHAAKDMLAGYEYLCSDKLKLTDTGIKNFPVFVDQETMLISFAHSVDQELSKDISEREGKRLLVGKSCFYKNRRMFVKEVRSNGMVMLSDSRQPHLPEDESIITVPLTAIALIERAGVSEYDLLSLPKSFRDAKFQWTCEMQVKDKSFVNFLHTRIRQVHVNKMRDALLRVKKHPISGSLTCFLLMHKSLVEPRDDTKGSAKTVEVIVFKKKETGQREEILRKTSAGAFSEGRFSHWATSNCPNIRFFKVDHIEKLESEGMVIQFKVFDNKTEFQGSAEVSLNALIDLDSPAKEVGFALKSDDPENCGVTGQLFVQTLFEPSKRTKADYSISTSHVFKTPSESLHFSLLTEEPCPDKYGYFVPLSMFSPTPGFCVVSDEGRPLSLQSEARREQAEKYLLAELDAVRKITGKSHLPRLQKQQASSAIAVKLRGFSTPQEVIDFCINATKKQRPLISELTLHFADRWQKMKQLSRIQVNQAVAFAFWDNLLEQLIDGRPRISAEDMRFNLNSTRVLDRTLTSVKIDELYAKAQNQSHQSVLERQTSFLVHNSDADMFLFTGKWQETKDAKFSDIHFLVHQAGIPQLLRPLVWRSLLKVELVEFAEINNFKKNFSNHAYQSHLSLYDNYKLVATKEDCLAFRQIDEDVKKIHSHAPLVRSVLRALVLWSKFQVINGKSVSFAYTPGLIKITQRLATIVDVSKPDFEEDVFWILNGLIRAFPRPYSVESSILESDCTSLWRYELVAFKTLVQKTLPDVFQKLQDFGLPLELLVHEPILSFYADFFDSELVLRLWDVIVLNFSTGFKEERKRGIWYVLAPAFLVLRERRSFICSANSCELIYQAFKSGQTVCADPNLFVAQLTEICDQVFEEGSKPKQSFLSSFFGLKLDTSSQNQVALDFEKQRADNQEKLKHISESIQKENNKVNQLVTKHETSRRYLDYEVLRKHTMAEINRIALASNVQEDKLYEFEESQIARHDLPISKVHVYLHKATLALGQADLKVKVSYGRISIEKNFVFEENQVGQLTRSNPFSSDTESGELNNYCFFKYANGQNTLRIQFFDKDLSKKPISEVFVGIRDLPMDRFIQKHLLLRSNTLLSTVNNIDTLHASFFIEFDHAGVQRKDILFRHLSTIRKKMPDRIDIFNQKQDEQLSKSFETVVRADINQLKTFLEKEHCLDIINESYSHVLGGSYGNLSMSQFLDLSKVILPKAFRDEELLRKIYNDFSWIDEPQSTPSPGKTPGENEKIRADSRRSYLRNSAQLNELLDPQEHVEMHFCLRQFFVTFVLLSHSTVLEKLDVLYDVFDWVDGVSDGIRPSAVFELIQTLFERNLYFWPAHELQNLCETVFAGSVSMVHKAEWGPLVGSYSLISVAACQEILQSKKSLQPGQSIDISSQVQQAFTQYFSVFGSKVIDFNADVSPFKNLHQLVGSKEVADLLLLAALNRGSQYHITLHCAVGGEKFTYMVAYDRSGVLYDSGINLRTQSSDCKEAYSVQTYLERDAHRLSLVGLTRPISKQEFLQKTARIPLLQDLIRCETFYRDRLLPTMKNRSVIKEGVTISIVHSGLHFVFKFEPRLVQRTEGKHFKEVAPISVVLEMTEAHKEDTLLDLRKRVSDALIRLSEYSKEGLGANVDVEEKSFFVLEKGSWVLVQNDFERLSNFEGLHEYVFQLGSRKQQEVARRIAKDVLFDSKSLYRHSDKSLEWRPCRIVRRKMKSDFSSAKMQSFDVTQQCFDYVVEFEHLQEFGRDMQVERTLEEVLLSARYTREMFRNFPAQAMNHAILTNRDI